MVGLDASDGDDTVVLLCHGISKQELQFAHLQRLLQITDSVM
jgi:hypothetical protein